MSATITWASFWGIRRQTDEDRRNSLDRQIGFLLEDDHVLIDQRLLDFLDSCSISELEEFLGGAPIQLSLLFLNRLPLASAKLVIKEYRIQDAELLLLAHRKPPRIRERNND